MKQFNHDVCCFNNNNRELFSDSHKKKAATGGFTLVELIIVLAIMAALVGVVAATVIPYMEKSREAKDQQILSSITTAVVSASTECANELPSFNMTYDKLMSLKKGDENNHDIQEFAEIFRGYMNNESADALVKRFKSKAFTGLTAEPQKDDNGTTTFHRVYIAYYSGELTTRKDKNGKKVSATSGGDPTKAFPDIKAHQCITYVAPKKNLTYKNGQRIQLDKYMYVASD